MQNNEVEYYRARRLFNSLLKEGLAETKGAAELFYYLNRTGYNGLCRFNKSGEFNVPFGSYKTINYTSDFTPYKRIFSSWEFRRGDFEDMTLRSSDFVYADPPYDVDFTHYSKEGFRWEDQVRLAVWLAEHRGPVILSNQATPRIIKLYENLGFGLQFLQAPRMISCTGDRTRAREVLAFKNL